jgi:hypothetical protein
MSRAVPRMKELVWWKGASLFIDETFAMKLCRRPVGYWVFDNSMCGVELPPTPLREL